MCNLARRAILVPAILIVLDEIFGERVLDILKQISDVPADYLNLVIPRILSELKLAIRDDILSDGPCRLSIGRVEFDPGIENLRLVSADIAQFQAVSGAHGVEKFFEGDPLDDLVSLGILEKAHSVPIHHA